ncbi:MAG TPA: type III-A CRISPR-associated RAMP protein Csm5 [Symbiobacteriaceae bacterium]|nr:type III-A CRISPR-associated RAMP protein Csm5 [Symbiobacteriaceae bacterium]
MKIHLETRQLILHLRCPVHVGTRVRQLSPLEAVPVHGRIYVMHEDRLAALLLEQRCLDEFVIAVGRDGAQFDLRGFLERKRLLQPDLLARVATYSTVAPAGVSVAQQVAFRPHIRGALGEAYLPGSSLKGAMRNALLNGVINGRPKEKLLADVDGQIARGARRERFADPVVAGLLEGRLPLGLRNPRRVTGQNLDYLRCLKVGDAIFSGETVVHPVQVLSLQRGDDRFYLKEQMLLECLPTGATLMCAVTLDHGLLSEFKAGGSAPPFADLAELLGLVTQHASAVLDFEYGFADGLNGAEALFDFYGQTDANLRVGLGSGLPSTTILLNLPKEQRIRIRDQVLRMRRDSDFFPKSRKVVTRGREVIAPLGWIHWEVAP